ncbi:MAG: trypsin-like serine protease [Kofleriaceae bacterium]|nr:trypsin-like serine protease [Kofleriaceae bacterium]
MPQPREIVFERAGAAVALGPGMSRIACCFLLISSLAAAQPAPVVGGSKVPTGAWPDVAAVIAEAGTCSGTLVAPDVVLTAGHCIDIAPYEVVLASTDYARGGERIAVKAARAFPAWWDRFDAGVLILERAARTPPRLVASACTANALLKNGTPLRIVGFGATTPAGDDRNTRLYEATIPILDAYCETDESCGEAARPKGEFTAGGRGTDSCFGDSGGPAFVDTPAGPALVGVVSRGLDVPGQPCGNGGVYVRADKLISWIQSVTSRQLTRTSCDGPRDAAEPVEEGGCMAAPGTAGGAWATASLLWVLARARNRRRGGSRP